MMEANARRIAAAVENDRRALDRRNTFEARLEGSGESAGDAFDDGYAPASDVILQQVLAEADAARRDFDQRVVIVGIVAVLALVAEGAQLLVLAPALVATTRRRVDLIERRVLRRRILRRRVLPEERASR